MWCADTPYMRGWRSSSYQKKPPKTEEGGGSLAHVLPVVTPVVTPVMTPVWVPRPPVFPAMLCVFTIVTAVPLCHVATVEACDRVIGERPVA